MEQLGSHWTDFHYICLENSSCIKNLTGKTGALHEDRQKFLIIYNNNNNNNNNNNIY